MKPGDFFLNLSDFFAVLLPGLVATWILVHYLPASAVCGIDPGFVAKCELPNETVRGVSFLLVSYLLGHFTFMAGARLDQHYDRWRVRKKATSEDRAFQAAKRLREQLTPDLVDDDFTVLKWAKAYIEIHSEHSRGEIDRFEADSKFFRGIVVVSVPLALHFLLGEHRVGLTAGAVGLGIASFVRYREQRWKSTELAYGTAAILHATKR